MAMSGGEMDFGKDIQYDQCIQYIDIARDETVPFLENAKDSESDFEGTSNDNFGGASLTSAVFNLSTSIIGAGIMALPSVMKITGLPCGVVLLIIMGFVTEYSLEILLKFSRKSNVWTYGRLVSLVLGDTGKLFLYASVMLTGYGPLVGYLIIIGDVLSGSTSGGIQHEGLLVKLAGESTWWNGRAVVITITVLLLIPFCAVKHIDSLRYTSGLSVALAVVFIVMTVGITIMEGALGRLKTPRMLPDFSSFQSIFSLFTVIPMITLAYVCHFNVHSICIELKDPSESMMSRVSQLSLLLCTFIYAVTAGSCYLLFGDATSGDVLANFDKNLGVPYSSLISATTQLGYALHLFFVFPVVHFACRHCLDAVLFPHAGPLLKDQKRHVILTAVMIISTFAGAVAIPTITIIFQFIGSTSAVALGFGFPAAIVLLWNHSGSVLSTREKVQAWALLVAGLLTMISGLTANILNIINGKLG